MSSITIVLFCLALLAAARPGSAVVVSASDPGAETPAPSPDPGLAHVALIAGLSGVYLGDGWVLTAGHVLTAARNQKKTEAMIEGRSFPLRLGSVVPLRSGGQRADLALVRIEGDPGLSRLEIVGATPALGTDLVLVGNGPLQEPHRTCWNESGIEQRAGSAGAICGFKWRKKEEGRRDRVQWGTNQVAETGSVLAGPQGTRTRVFATVFRDAGASPREAQAGVGDSGGPVFVASGSGHALAGVMIGIAARSREATLFGDRTYVADLAAYRDAILRHVRPGRAAAEAKPVR